MAFLWKALLSVFKDFSQFIGGSGLIFLIIYGILVFYFLREHFERKRRILSTFDIGVIRKIETFYTPNLTKLAVITWMTGTALTYLEFLKQLGSKLILKNRELTLTMSTAVKITVLIELMLFLFVALQITRERKPYILDEQMHLCLFSTWVMLVVFLILILKYDLISLLLGTAVVAIFAIFIGFLLGILALLIGSWGDFLFVFKMIVELVLMIYLVIAFINHLCIHDLVASAFFSFTILVFLGRLMDAIIPNLGFFSIDLSCGFILVTAVIIGFSLGFKGNVWPLLELVGLLFILMLSFRYHRLVLSQFVALNAINKDIVDLREHDAIMLENEAVHVGYYWSIIKLLSETFYVIEFKYIGNKRSFFGVYSTIVSVSNRFKKLIPDLIDTISRNISNIDVIAKEMARSRFDIIIALGRCGNPHCRGLLKKYYP